MKSEISGSIKYAQFTGKNAYDFCKLVREMDYGGKRIDFALTQYERAIEISIDGVFRFRVCENHYAIEHSKGIENKDNEDFHQDIW